MQRALIIATPLVLAVPVVYAIAFANAGYPLMLGPMLAGAAGWFVALVLRTPVGLAGMRITGSTERTQTWVTASSGPLEESVRLAVLLIVGRDLATALWIGLGWAAIEVLYSIVNGFAVAALATRTDPEAEQARAMLPPNAFSAAAPFWGVVERAWASAVHIGFTLILAAAPLLVLVTAPLHTLLNVAFLRLIRTQPMIVVSVAGIIAGGAILAVGFLLH